MKTKPLCNFFGVFTALILFSSISANVNSQEVEIKQVDAVKAICIKVEVPSQEIGTKMEETYEKLFTCLGSKKVEPAGPPFAVYYSYDPQGNTVFESGIPIVASIDTEGDIIYKEYPAMKAVSYLFKGSYENMVSVYDMLSNYMKENQLESTGVSWEVYLTNPMEVTDQAENQTIIYFPLK